MRRQLLGLVLLAAGCGGDPAQGLGIAVPTSLSGMNDDPNWVDSPVLEADGGVVGNTTLGGYASAGDLINDGITRVRFVLKTKSLDPAQERPDGCHVLDRVCPRIAPGCRDYNHAIALYDAIIANRRSATIDSLVVLNTETVPFPTRAYDRANWDAYVQHFACVAGAIAGHWQGEVEAYEIGNEQNDNTKPGQYVPPDLYGRQLAAAHDAIGGSALVISGGVFQPIGNPIDDTVSWLQSVPGLTDSADAIGVHPYGCWPGQDFVPPNWADKPLLEDMINALDVAFPGKKLWLTEWNVPDDQLGDDVVGNKSNMFQTFFLTAAGDARIDHAYFFGWSDKNENNFGLLDAGGNEKEYVKSFRADLQRQASARDTRTVDGSVVDDSGNPVQAPYGITIYATGRAGVAVRDDGTFTLPPFDAGRAYLVLAVNDRGQLGYGIWSGNVVGGAEPVSLNVQLPSEAVDPTAPSGAISGRVTTADGKAPATDAVLFVYCGGRRAKVAADGSYRLDGVPSGVRTLALANLGGVQRYKTATWAVTVGAMTTTPLDLTAIPF